MQLSKGYTEVLIGRTRRRSSATWTPDGLDMGLEAFQVVVGRLEQLAGQGVVLLLEKRRLVKGKRPFDLVKFRRL